MATIYRASDVIPLKIDGLTVHISPLTFEQKMKIQSAIIDGKTEGPMRAAKLACQYAVKKIEGIETVDGSKYEVEVENGKLSDECWDDLQNIQETGKLITVCLNLINGVPKEFVNPETGLKLEGVKIIKEEAKGKKK